MGRPNSEPTLKGGGEIKSAIRNLVTTAVKSRTGPSFDERLADAVEKKNVEMKDLERSQWKRIHDCRDRGRQKSEDGSVLKGLAGMTSIKEIQMKKFQERERAVSAQAKTYWNERRAMMDKIRTREPLFRLSDVAGAQDQLKQQAEKRRNELREDERKRREMLEEINRSVLNRPLLMG